MARLPHVIVPGVAHHVTQRGNNRQPVFQNDDDRSLYLRLLQRHAVANGARILGYCLMTNHVHLVVTPERENSLARTFCATHAEYAHALNQKRQTSGHIWQGRYYSCPLDEAHMERAMLYVDLNPVRAAIVSTAWEWPWSSARAHAAAEARDLVLDREWDELTGGWNHVSWREQLESALTEQDTAALRRATRRGVPLGSEAFIDELERRAGRRLRLLERGRPKKQPAPAVTAA
ncbi:MAG TPA: transposase [Candidatus Sulfopaludibacter sp.]|jgi:putative transposase|nr:transposase [Candidatus Sulfopaludibacter sp.]